MTEGEYHSAFTINEALSRFIPKPVGWGKYHNGESLVFFFLGDFHDMHLSIAPEPANFMSKIAELHQSTSPNGMFGFHVPTVCGKMERTVTVSNFSCPTHSPSPCIDLGSALLRNELVRTDSADIQAYSVIFIV